MSGHSKWANIKRQKGKADAARGKIFTKLGRQIAIAVREGGGDPKVNGKLRDIIAEAKANNMPGDTVTRSIKKAAGELGSVQYEEIVYEGYGAGGVAVIAECVTDNRNRTASDVRHAFDKCGGALGTSGSVGYMFDRRGMMVVERVTQVLNAKGKPESKELDEDEVMMQAMDAGASDFNADEDVFEITCDPADFSACRTALEEAGLSFLSASITRVPQTNIDMTNPEVLENVKKLLDMLEEMDDVMNVYHNAILPEEDEE
jgi:YebC/PmpR family DNA-binding regulatory protein